MAIEVPYRLDGPGLAKHNENNDHIISKKIMIMALILVLITRKLINNSNSLVTVQQSQ